MLIPNRDLKRNDLPPPGSTWQEIAAFAQTLNGYEAAGSIENAGLIANNRRADTLTDLRICLFFE